MSAAIRTVEEALAGLRTGVRADGYDLQVESVDDGVARVRVVAGPDACEECLVPKAIMTGTIRRSLRGVPEVTSVLLRYPYE